MNVVTEWKDKEEKEHKEEMEISPVVATSVAELVAKHGEEVIVKIINERVAKASEAKAVALLKKGKREEVAAAVAAVVLHVRTPKDPAVEEGKVAKRMEKFLEIFNALPAEKKAEYLAQIKK